MSEHRNFTTEQLIGKLDAARGWIHNAYLEYSNDGTPDAVLAGAQANEVVMVTKALHAKGYNMSDEERSANQEVIKMSREIRGLPMIGGPDPNVTVQQPLQLVPSSPLKKEKIPRFTGEFKEYARFKLVFDDLVDQDNQMTESTKVRHLIEHLEGKAADLVTPYIGVPGAYEKMRQALREEYEETKHLKEHLKAEIEKLPRITDKYDDKMHDFRNVVHRVQCAAEQTNEDFRKVLYSMVLDRFSDRIADDLVKKDFSLKDLLERFSRWRREKENMISAGRLRSPKADSTDPRARAPMRPSPRRVAAGQSTRDCIFCGSNVHFTDQCNHPPGPQRCKELAARHRLCFVCLRAGHRASDRECPRFGHRCRACQTGNHHLLLCSPSTVAPPPNNYYPASSSRSYSPQRRASPIPPRSNQLPSPPARRMLTYGGNHSARSPSSDRGRNVSPVASSSSSPKPAVVGIVRNVNKRIEECGTIGTACIQGPVKRHYLEAVLNGRRIRILLDSGADVSLIERRLVPHSSQIFKGAEHCVSGLGGLSTTSDMCRVEFAGNGVTPIGLALYLQNELPDIDIIVGRFEIPLLLKSEALDEGRLYYDTVFGRVYMSDRTEVNNRLAYCFRAAFVDAPTKALVNELMEPEPEPEIPLEVKQMPNGRFRARLPFLPGQKPKNNFWPAKHRQVRLQERLERTGFTEDYRSHLMEYVANGHAVPAPKVQCLWNDDAFYLPHREVIKETSTSTRFRIVFDASAGAPSLNDRLFKGNAEQLKLPDCLMRFRRQPVAVIADISKAFLQIEIDPADQSYLRFLWLDGPDLRVYQMCRLPFGLVSSPAILIQVINTLIDQHRATHPFAAELLKNSFYMDDLTLSVADAAEAERLRAEALEIFASAGFELAKWNTSDRGLQLKWNGQLTEDAVKVLGVLWKTEPDRLSVKCPTVPDLSPVTPRKMLQFIGAVFDVLGLLEPVKLHLKHLARQARVLKVQWDEQVPEPLATDFRKAAESFHRLADISAPRHVPPPAMVSIFADASELGVGYVIYFTDAQQRNHFITGKSKLAPLQQRTVPELELAAITEAVEQLPFLSAHYDLTNVPVVAWTNSSITLHRLGKNLNQYGSYVCNRLYRIRQICERHPVQFRYVPTKLNPADLYSRPQTVTKFLKLVKVDLQLNLQKLLESADAHELPKVNIACVARAELTKLVELPGYERCSEWSQVVRTTYHLIIGCSRLLKCPREVTVQQALTYIFRQIQRESLTELRQLKLPYVTDKRGIIRVRTRASSDQPVWIPSNSRMALLIVRHCHAVTGHHMRRRVTKAIVNERYYIPRVNRLIDRVLRTCVPCQKSRLKLISQPVGDLPQFRHKDFLPFECIGIDYFGAIKLSTRTKVWVLIVTCSVSRAVHLEIVHDLSSDACLAALNCVFNYRGLPKIVVSDNGTNFTAAEKDLSLLRRQLREQKNEIAEIDIQWHFNPPRASWWGGWFERMVGVVKSVLRKLKPPSSVEVLRYQLAEVMSVVNSRPLFATDSEADTVITPGHYLIGRSFTSVPCGPKRLSSFGTLNQLKLVRKRFLQLWRSEYLRALGTHFKRTRRTEIKVGDLVLLPDNANENWSLARVEAVEPGPDGVVRQVTLRVPDLTDPSQPRSRGRPIKRLVSRAAQSLVLLELESDGGRAECQGDFLEVMASDEAVRESSSARSIRRPAYRQAAEHLARDPSDDVNVSGATPHHISPPHVPLLMPKGI